MLKKPPSEVTRVSIYMDIVGEWQAWAFLNHCLKETVLLSGRVYRTWGAEEISPGRWRSGTVLEFSKFSPLELMTALESNKAGFSGIELSVYVIWQ